MSKALDYLLATRPDAMGAYFKFLKLAGGSLDPKTRALISILTKVGSQTEAGLKQYLTRALQQGVTPNEVLDALLMAFPMLGLSKIVWAVDVILALDLPEFKVEALARVPAWHRLGSSEKPAIGATIRVECEDREVFVYRDSQTVYQVYDSRCPHQVTNIPLLGLDDKCLTCPRHGWTFDVRTGACVSGGDRPLRQFPSKAEDGQLYVYW